MNMKKILGIVLFLGFMWGASQASTESIFNGYESKLAPSPLTCPNTNTCSTLSVVEDNVLVGGFQKYYKARCLERKASSGCSQALCRGDCAKSSEVNEPIEKVSFTSASNQRFTLKEVCRQVCPTVTLSEVDIERLKQTGVLGEGKENYTYTDHAQEIIQKKVQRELEKNKGKASKQTEKQLSKAVGGYGVTGLSKLHAKRLWEKKWLDYYISRYNKEVAALNTYYDKNISRLYKNLQDLNKQMAAKVGEIESGFKDTSAGTLVAKKLAIYKERVEVKEEPRCPAPLCQTAVQSS
jgi:hypothetical protein